jgi:2-hydroxychromene-2-carboxylate isomerase
MTQSTPLEFWFDFASTYSYVAARRAPAIAAARGVELVFQPFVLGPIFAAQGWNDSPFNIYPAKGRYMWRDLERLCADAEIPLRRPSKFPRNSVLGARVALVAREDGFVEAFTRALFHANFAEDQDIGDPAVVRAVIDGLGRPGAEILERAVDEAHKPLLRRQTERATALGIFGAPSFVRGSELFWGNDRLDAALRFNG